MIPSLTIIFAELFIDSDAIYKRKRDGIREENKERKEEED